MLALDCPWASDAVRSIPELADFKNAGAGWWESLPKHLCAGDEGCSDDLS